jgi:4'-phosphopantetheinyl transferase
VSRTPLNQLPAVSVAETLASGEGIVDLWCYLYEDADPELLASHQALLTPDELERSGGFRFERDRRLFLATRALVRTVLSNYAAVSPKDWRFATNEHGKPFISAPKVTPAVYFNLANTQGLVVCAVCVAHEPVGVDAERIDREVEAVALADRFFSPSEASRLRGLCSAEQSELFFSYWTLKESYIKARGLGLTLPLGLFSFRVDDEIGIGLEPRFADDASTWRFALLDARPHYRIAISVKTGGARLSLRATRVVPLRDRVDPT